MFGFFYWNFYGTKLQNSSEIEGAERRRRGNAVSVKIGVLGCLALEQARFEVGQFKTAPLTYFGDASDSKARPW